ncbi:MAG TPA: hypothetical protein VGU46_00835 [Acidobacteriaceae bacterium]|nr:hypothetical protein [Acidobacteriaceae bacterium]
MHRSLIAIHGALSCDPTTFLVIPRQIIVILSEARSAKSKDLRFAFAVAFVAVVAIAFAVVVALAVACLCCHPEQSEGSRYTPSPHDRPNLSPTNPTLRPARKPTTKA